MKQNQLIDGRVKMKPNRNTFIKRFFVMSFLIVFQFGCESDLRVKSQKMNTKTAEKKVEFDCQITETDLGLKIEFTVQNNLEDAIYIFSPIAEFEAEELVPKPTRVYVTVAGKVCHIQKTLFEVPDSIDVYMPEVPFLTLIRPDKKVSETIELPKQMIANFPYQFAEGKATAQKNERADSLVFKLGYLIHSEDLDSLEEIKGGLYSISYSDGIQNQEFLESDSFNISLDVIVPLLK